MEDLIAHHCQEEFLEALVGNKAFGSIILENFGDR